MVLFVGIGVALGGCELAEREDLPDVAIPPACFTGAEAVQVSGTVVDFATGAPIAGARVDLTEAWAGEKSFPSNGCHLGGATTDDAGRFGPISVLATLDPTIVMLVTGAGRAPTIADRNSSCLFGPCTPIDQLIEAPSQELALAWRRDLYDGGMEFALNRGLVMYRYDEPELAGPAAGVAPVRAPDSFLDDAEPRPLEPGVEVRFVKADRRTLEPAQQPSTTTSGYALIGTQADAASGYFDVEGDRTGMHWHSVGVMAATGWIYTETARP
jgi:hypothetical protein